MVTFFCIFLPLNFSLVKLNRKLYVVNNTLGVFGFGLDRIDFVIIEFRILIFLVTINGRDGEKARINQVQEVRLWEDAEY